MIMRRVVVSLCTVSLCSVFPAGAVLAEGWSIKDLGSQPSEAGCVDLAWKTFAYYRSARELGDLQKAGWMVYAYDLDGEAYDAVITCSYGPEDTTRATLAVYASDMGGGTERRDIAERIEQYWEQIK